MPVMAGSAGAIRKNPTESPIVQVPVYLPSDVAVWDDAVVLALADAHPAELRAIPELAASLGMRAGSRPPSRPGSSPSRRKTSAAASVMRPPAKKAFTNYATTTPASCSPEASASGS